MLELEENTPAIEEEYSSSKHSDKLIFFNGRFIKGKIFDENVGRSINKAFDLRQRGDYREHLDLKNRT